MSCLDGPPFEIISIYNNVFDGEKSFCKATLCAKQIGSLISWQRKKDVHTMVVVVYYLNDK